MPFLGVRISQDLRDEIDAEGRPISDIMRAALNLYFQQKDVKHPVKHDVKQVKPPVKRPKKTLNRDVKQPPSDPVKQAKRFILAELEAGREPTAGEVADVVGIDARALGPLMKAEGLQAKTTRRKGKGGRYYTFDLMEKLKMGEE